MHVGENDIFTKEVFLLKKLFILLLSLFLVSGLIAGCAGNAQQEPVKENVTKETAQVLVSAAASLKDALAEIKSVYEGKNDGIELVYNFGSSGMLQQQIEQGSPVDLFISAGKKQMDALEEKNLIKIETRTDLLGNELVLITGKDNKTVNTFADLSKPEVQHIGIGNPASVPAGKYTQEALTSMKLWDALQSKYVAAKDVRQVLSYVETGNAEAGLVYKSDTIVSDKVRIAITAPKESHQPIVYPAAVIGSAENAAAADEFLKFLQSAEAKQIFVKYGFTGA